MSKRERILLRVEHGALVPADAHSQQRLRENRYKGGNVVEYRIRLIQRIGLEAVEALEQDSRAHKWTRDELREVRDTYHRKLREIMKERKA